MSKPLILVTGAAGKTGAPVVEQLIDRGFPVRALVRQLDDRSSALEQKGAEVVIGDFVDLGSIRSALRGVQRAYFCYPPQGDQLVEATAIFATAAKEAGVEAVVNMSQVTARDDAPSSLSRHHWHSQNVFDWADVGAIHVRPTYFAENLLMFGSDSIANEGKLYLPYGDGRHAPVAAADIAEVVVSLLANPEPYLGERLVLTGPRKMTIAEMTSVLSEELGSPVEYVDLPIDMWGEILAGQAGLPAFLVSHLKHVAQDHKDGVFDVQSDTVERVTGRPAQSLAAFVREHREAFSGGYVMAPAR